jgi:alpha-glucosidase
MSGKNEQQESNWLKRAVVYQIYPRSFKDTNGDGIGDLEGIIEKLDYLNDGTKNSLGINAIWISPIYVSPMVDFGYDVADHCNIDPVFGDLKIFDRLIKEAHKRGIKVLMDFIPNHTSSEHPWFMESRLSLTNPKRNWFVWRSPKPDGSPPNNWLSKAGGSAWTYDEKTEQYYMHSFMPQQPDLNWRNKEVRNEMKKVMRFWLDRGVDGFRTDAINYLLESESFEDEPINPNYIPGKDSPYKKFLHIYSHGRQETLFTTDVFCEVLNEYKNKYMLSESFLGIDEMVDFYKICPGNLIIPFNFNLISLSWSATEYRKFVDEFEEALAGGYWPNYVVGNHDISRVASRIGEDRARLIAMLIFTLRGTPFIYYGDEIGMKDVPIEPEKALDPRGKTIPGLGFGRDPERAPMQWSKKKYAGFSSSKPWLPVMEDYKTYNVEEENKDSHSILNLYKCLIHSRSSSRALVVGSYRSLDIDSEDIFAYCREYEDEKFFILLNFSDKSQAVNAGAGKGEIVCSTHLNKTGKSVDLDIVPLKPYEGYVIKVKI